MAVIRTDWITTPRQMDKILLDRNESIDPVFQELVIHEIKELLKDPQLLFRYPNQARLYQALAAFENVGQDHLYLTNGSTDALEQIIKKLKPKKMVLPSPTYDMVRVYAELYAESYETVPFTLDVSSPLVSENRFTFPEELFLKTCRDADLIYIAQPDNPTGFFYNEDFIRALIALNKPIIIDEAYIEHVPGAMSFKDMACNLDHVFVVKTFSKSYGMCGFRVGHVISSKDTITKFQNERIPYSTTSLSTELLVNLLTHHQDALRASIDRVIEGKAYFESQIPCVPAYGNYALAKSVPLRLKDLVAYKEVMGLYRIAMGTKEFMEKVIKESLVPFD